MNTPLDIYDDYPKAMRRYLQNYGWTFSKNACDYAVSLIRKINPATGKKETIQAADKEAVNDMLEKYGVRLEHNTGYDYVYVYNKAFADCYKSSVPDEQHLALHVKDVIDDVDNEGGNVFRKWYADMVGKGMPVDWEEIL